MKGVSIHVLPLLSPAPGVQCTWMAGLPLLPLPLPPPAPLIAPHFSPSFLTPFLYSPLSIGCFFSLTLLPPPLLSFLPHCQTLLFLPLPVLPLSCPA